MAFFLPLLALAALGGIGAASQNAVNKQPDIIRDQGNRNNPRNLAGGSGTRSMSGGGNFGSLQDMLGINKMFSGMGQLGASMSRGQMEPSISDIMAHLQSLSDPSRYMSDQSSLSAQARAAAEAQYGPLIASLKNQMAQAEMRGAHNKKELGSMFSGLSSSLAGDIPKVQQQFAQTKDETSRQYDELKGTISNTYQQSQADQESMLKRLNIEAAASETLPAQMRDRDYFTNLAAKEGQTAQTALGMEERGATEFTRQGSQIAQIEGTQRQANLMEQLRMMLDTLQGQVGAHEAAKEQAYTSGLGSLSMQSQQQAQQRAQQEFQNYIAATNLGRGLKRDEFDFSQSQQKPIDKVSSISQFGPKAMQLGLGLDGAQRIQEVFMNAQTGNDALKDNINPEWMTTLSNPAKVALIVEEGRRAGLSQQELTVLQILASDLYGA